MQQLNFKYKHPKIPYHQKDWFVYAMKMATDQYYPDFEEAFRLNKENPEMLADVMVKITHRAHDIFKNILHRTSK